MSLHWHELHGVVARVLSLTYNLSFLSLLNLATHLYFPSFQVRESPEESGTFDEVGSRSTRHDSKCRTLPSLDLRCRVFGQSDAFMSSR